MAQDLKAQGNAAFSAGDYDNAIKLFSQAIELDGSAHVLFSNRSAAHAARGAFADALSDADRCISINPNWPKGYSRRGAALHGLGRLEEARDAYTKGLEVDPENAALKRDLAAVNDAIEQDKMPKNPFEKIFSSPDIFTKLAGNPKTASLLAQPDFVAKLNQIRANPAMANTLMQGDQRIMMAMLVLMGIDAQFGNAGEGEANKEEEGKGGDSPSSATAAEEDAPLPSSSKSKEPEPEPEPELNDEEKAARDARAASDLSKQKGNEFYKKKQFTEALTHYEAAWDADNTNVAVLTNKAAVLFEMGRFEECIKECEMAVEKGREVRADFKLIARALGRIGSAYLKLDDLDNAIKYFNKSLTEHRTADILTKLRETEKLAAEKARLSYIDPVKSDEARERGNAFFKQGAFSDAIKEYTEAIKRNDTDPRAYSNRAACYCKLMACSEAEKDANKALELDPKFVKAVLRKAQIEFAKREYMNALDLCREAKDLDTESKHSAEIQQQMMRCYQALQEVQGAGANAGGTEEERLQRAMQNPEVQKIMGDPAMRVILEQMQQDPSAARDHMKNPAVAAKIRTLINAGIIQTR